MAHMRDWFHTGGQRERERERKKTLFKKRKEAHNVNIYKSINRFSVNFRPKKLSMLFFQARTRILTSCKKNA